MMMTIKGGIFVGKSKGHSFVQFDLKSVDFPTIIIELDLKCSEITYCVQ